ncbi:MAG TPA: zinc ribbon domain-containing protein [Ktedonobacteraceae bacterium]
MNVVLQEESYTSKTCPRCGHRRKSPVQGRNVSCAQCGFRYHRDGVGAMNTRYKYREEFGAPHVVGAMAPPTGMRYTPHTRVARREKMYLREAA